YGFRIDSLAFLPKGEDAASYIAVGQQGRRYFVRAQRTAFAPNLEVAFDAVARLQAECKLPQVVAPYRRLRGRYTCRYRGYTVAVFPFVAGRTAYENGQSPESE